MASGRLGLPDDRWLGLALVLNFCPAVYVEDSWLDEIPHGLLVRRLRTEPLAGPYLSRFLREALELNSAYCDDFSDPMARLALLDGDSLQRLFLYLGLTLRSAELRTEIRGAQVNRLKRALGDRVYAFALRRAPFLGSLPDFPFEPGSTDPAERFAQIGLQYCWGRFAVLGAGLVRRLFLKLPRDWSAGLSARAGFGTALATPPELPPLVRKLVKEVLPRWTPLFA